MDVEDPVEHAAVDTHIHLLMQAGGNRELLAEWLSETYDVSTGDATTTDLEGSDLCIVDASTFDQARGTLTAYRQARTPERYPILLVAPERDGSQLDADVWETVDDVVHVPIRQVELAARLRNLVRQRALWAQLDASRGALDVTVQELQLLRRAVDAAPNGVTIANATEPDTPIEYVNAAFKALTGYGSPDLDQYGFRCLLGPATDHTEYDRVETALENGAAVTVTLINYRADGTQFWNRIDTAPVYGDQGDLAHIVAFHTDVTQETIRSQRLSVLNRVLRHNLRNGLNIITGYADRLGEVLDDAEQFGEVFDDADVQAGLAEITRSADKLTDLGQHAGDVEAIIGRIDRFDVHYDVADLVEARCSLYTGAFPEVTVDLTVIEGPWVVQGNGLDAALDELLDNAISYGDPDEPRIKVSVGQDPKTTDRVRIAIADNGPGIPDEVTTVLASGKETQLRHGDGLGLWLAYWVTTLLGGDISFDTTDTGTIVELTLPLATPEGPEPDIRRATLQTETYRNDDQPQPE